MDRAGIETMLMNYYRHMDRSKVQFDFLCNKVKPGAYDNEIKSMGGRIYHTPGLNPVKYPDYLKYMKKLFMDHPEYKVVEAHNGAVGVYALYAANRNKIPVRIFHAHTANTAKNWKYPIKLVCKMFLASNINRRYTCSAAAAKYFYGKKIVSSNNYELIPNAIEVNRFIYNHKIRQKIRMENNLVGKHVIGHVGRFIKEKNHNFLITLFKEIAQRDPLAHLVLIGDGKLISKIQLKALESGIADKVTFIGNVSNVNEWYQAFDCFVMPSRWEGLPLVGIEAQAADLPCVFSEQITKEVALSDRVVFMSLNESVMKWAEIVQNMLTITERRNNSRLIAEKNYDINVEAAKLQNKYLELAGEGMRAVR